MELPVIIALALCAAVGYLLGSISWSIILTKKVSGEDIRNQGSGNAGMTNVLRTVGKLPAILTFAGDFLKCVAAALLAWGIIILGFQLAGHSEAPGFELTQIAKFLAGAGCVLGHAFPLYHGFRGGKCIVTSAAMILMTDWRVFLLILATFGIVFLVKRIISLGSVCCAALYPVYTFLLTYRIDYLEQGCSVRYLQFVMLLSVGVCVLVLWKHRANIDRLRRGEEKPIRAKKTEK